VTLLLFSHSNESRGNLIRRLWGTLIKIRRLHDDTLVYYRKVGSGPSPGSSDLDTNADEQQHDDGDDAPYNAADVDTRPRPSANIAIRFQNNTHVSLLT